MTSLPQYHRSRRFPEMSGLEDIHFGHNRYPCRGGNADHCNGNVQDQAEDAFHALKALFHPQGKPHLNKAVLRAFGRMGVKTRDQPGNERSTGAATLRTQAGLTVANAIPWLVKSDLCTAAVETLILLHSGQLDERLDEMSADVRLGSSVHQTIKKVRSRTARFRARNGP